MADLTDLTEVAHWWGSDIGLTASGDIAVVGQGSAGQVTKSQQRVLRRLMTNQGQYLFDTDYGGDVPQRVGQNLEIAKVQAQLSAQMQLEASVAPKPPPSVTVTPIGNGVSVTTSYTVAPQAIPAVLSFTAEP